MRHFFIVSICLCLSGCASWIQAPVDNEISVASKPIAWFQEIPASFIGAPIRAGYSEADITPYDRQWLAGYGVGRSSKSVRHPLRVQCLALEDRHGNRLMFVTLDLLGTLPAFVERIRQQIRSWPQKRILFSSSHTHSAPDPYGIWGNGLILIPLCDGKDQKYIDLVQNNTILAIEAAANGLRPAQIRFATGQAPPDISRGREDNPPDQTIAMLQIAFGAHTVTLFNYALHPDVMRGKYVSPDFVYFLRDHFEAATGGRLMFINGAVGGVQPQKQKKSTVAKNRRRWLRARQIGEKLAQRGLELLRQPIVPEQADIQFTYQMFPINIEGGYFRFAIALGLMTPISDAGTTGITPIYHIRIGPAEILTAPGEIFPERWAKIKPRLTGNPRFLLGLTDIDVGYILSQRDFHSGNHDYHASMSVGDQVGEELLRVYEQLLKEKKP